MEALVSCSSSKLLHIDRDRGFLCPRDHVVLSRSEICFFRSPKHVSVSFLRSISLQHRTTHPIFSSSSPSSSDTQTQIQIEEMQIQDRAETKTVHVKFQLHRECSFGQQFLIVGDDPMFGLWDPSNAVPMDWSDGHVWTVEVDIPIGKSIKFKFILKGVAENILWQPGPDRILQTWETEKTLSVCEDWDDAECQKIIEEEPTSNQNEDSSVDSEMLIVAENLIQPRGSPTTDVRRESTINKSITNPTEKPFTEKPMPIVADNIIEPKEIPQVDTNSNASGARSVTIAEEDPIAFSNKDMTMGGNTFGNNGRAVNVKVASTKDEDHLVSYDDVPVLVPGLTPLPIAYTEEASPNEVKKNTAAKALLQTDKAKDLNVPEDEPVNESPHQTTEMVFNDEQELHDIEKVEKPLLVREQETTNTEPFDDSVLENDIQWGRRTLQKLLTNLGFL